jgi:hypothetical protein
MPRFVLLLHHCPADRPRATHFDLMFEAGDTLQTWALDRLPAACAALGVERELVAPSNTVAAQRLADHRRDYLEYEGQVSGDRGTVRRLDGGQYRLGELPLTFILNGRVLSGEIEIAANSDDSAACLLTYRPGLLAGASVSPCT